MGAVQSWDWRPGAVEIHIFHVLRGAISQADFSLASLMARQARKRRYARAGSRRVGTSSRSQSALLGAAWPQADYAAFSVIEDVIGEIGRHAGQDDGSWQAGVEAGDNGGGAVVLVKGDDCAATQSRERQDQRSSQASGRVCIEYIYAVRASVQQSLQAIA